MQRDFYDRPAIFARGVFIASLAVAVAVVGVRNRCFAGFILGDAASYAVLFEGAGNNHLSFSSDSGATGQVGVGNLNSGTPQVQLNGATITGSLLFAGTTNVAYSGGTVTGTVTGGNTSVDTDLTALNTLSSTLGAEAGISLTINIGNNQTQTVNINTGTLDASGNYVFAVSSMNFNNGGTLTIDGDATGKSVVFNFTANASFGGTIDLTGGINSDQVLFNVTGGSNLSGGNSLQISTNGATVTGTFLDPNGSISVEHALVHGRVFGGDTHDDMIVSGGYVTAPVPEPATLLLLGIGSCGLLLRRRTRR